MPNNSRFDSRALLDNRQVRIFLSSTFSDMEAERSALLHTFDTLRVKARRRNVDLAVLDLRWGVTDEEARSGKVVSVCLNEIEHSHPFFIGLLGSRYGYAPEAGELDKNPDLLERYPWLADDIAARRSITEMEMLYGVLRNEGDVDATFYIRQNGTPDDDPRQTALKERIRGQQRYPVADYASVDELCAMVEREVTALLDRHFPDVEATPLGIQRSAQRAYTNSLLDYFVGREEELSWIDDFVHSTEHYLVVSGESGLGKSALLARWCRQNEESDDFNLVYHFMGNPFETNSLANMLAHLCGELIEYYPEEDTDIYDESDFYVDWDDPATRFISEYCHPDDYGDDYYDECSDAPPYHDPAEQFIWLVDDVKYKKRPLVVVIDGINNLDAGKESLLWLPKANTQVKFIFSTLPDDATMRTFERRGYAVRTLQPLGDGQRRRFAEGYLERVGKHLSHAQWQRILSDPETQNTLVLRTLLDELICFGSHERLDARIDFYLAAKDIEDFFDRVLQRYEQDYGRDLVSRTLALLAFNEYSISEEELLDITGLRQMDWHLFYCAAYNHLVERDGLGFAHHYIANAVATRYAVADTAVSTSIRHNLVKFYASTPSEYSTLKLALLYYQLADWQHLYDTLVSFDAFDFYFDYFNDIDSIYFDIPYNTPQLTLYWRALLKAGFSLAAYLQLPHGQEDAALATRYNNIGFFVDHFFCDYSLALEYYGKALAIREKVLGTEHPSTAASYNNIGVVYKSMGDYDKALEYYGKDLAICEKVLGTEHPDTATSYNNIGLVYNNMGDYDKALEYHDKDLAIREKVLGTEHPHTATSYNNIGLVYDNMGAYDKALEYYGKALAIREKVLGTEHPDTATSYSNIGGVYRNMGDYDKALEYYGKALAIREKVLGTEHPSTATSYNNIGLVYNDMGDYAKALEYYGKALAICEKVLGTEHPDTASSYNNIGVTYYNQGNTDKALEYLGKALAIFKKKLGDNHPQTQQTQKDIDYIQSQMQ